MLNKGMNSNGGRPARQTLHLVASSNFSKIDIQEVEPVIYYVTWKGMPFNMRQRSDLNDMMKFKRTLFYTRASAELVARKLNRFNFPGSTEFSVGSVRLD